MIYIVARWLQLHLSTLIMLIALLLSIVWDNHIVLWLGTTVVIVVDYILRELEAKDE